MKGLGWKGHIRSAHDFQVRKLFKGVSRPKVVELWWDPSLVMDQDGVGACGPHALTTLYHSVMIENNMPNWERVNPWGLYYFYCEYTHELGQDPGVDNRILLDVAVKVGFPAYSLWPDDPMLWDTRPASYTAAKAYAADHQVLQYHAVNGLEEMLQTLTEGYAFMGGMPVYKSFEDVGPGGMVPMPGPVGSGDDYLGGHDLYFCGYDEYHQVLYGMNSWGTDWGKDGRFYLPFEYASRYLDGCYAITLQEG